MASYLIIPPSSFASSDIYQRGYHQAITDFQLATQRLLFPEGPAFPTIRSLSSIEIPAGLPRDDYRLGFLIGYTQNYLSDFLKVYRWGFRRGVAGVRRVLRDLAAATRSVEHGHADMHDAGYLRALVDLGLTLRDLCRPRSIRIPIMRRVLVSLHTGFG